MDEKRHIGSLFDRIAERYDLLNHLLSLNIDKVWRRKAVQMIPQSDTCLDVTIGTGDLAIELIRRNKVTTIQGIDLSGEMIRIGEDKVRRLAMTNRINFMQADAMKMPFADECFDVVTCAYGVRNFADMDSGLREMCRVMKVGGTLMILEFSYPENKAIAWAYDLYFSHILPPVGRMISRDKTAYTYLNRSVKNFVWGEAMCEQIRRAGFTDVRHTGLTFGITTIYTATKRG